MAARKSSKAKKKLPSMSLLKKAVSIGDVVRFFLHVGKTPDEVRGLIEERAKALRPIDALKGLSPAAVKSLVNVSLDSLAGAMVVGPIPLPEVFAPAKKGRAGARPSVAKAGARKAAPKVANKRNAKKAARDVGAKAPKVGGSKTDQIRATREASAAKRGSKRR